MGKTQFQPVSQILALVSLATLAFSPQSLAQSQKTCDLSGTISQILQRPEQQQTQWGIAIQDPQTDSFLFEHQVDTFFVPASNQKLLTTAAALTDLGADYQFQTPISLVRHIHGEVRYLVIEGQGDPTLTTAKLRTALEELKNQGITDVGEVIIIDSPPSATLSPTWEWSDLPWYYATAVNQLILNENVVTATVTPGAVGSRARVTWSDAIAARQWQLDHQLFTTPEGANIPPEPRQTYGTNTLTLRGELAPDAPPRQWFLSIPNPGRYALETVQTILRSQNITFKGGRVIDTDIQSLLPDPLNKESLLYKIEPLTAIASEPLAEILKTTNQDSNNLFAESLLKTLTTADRDPETILESIGVNPATYRLRDGSGLSRHNLVTPMALIQTLDGMLTHPQGEIYWNSLAIAGRTGTLQNRFQDTPVENHFFGKTGTMTHVSGLSGYLDLPDDSTLLVSILANQTGQSARITRQAIDDVVVAVHDWHSCSTTQP
ncbi:D-alanyl-D-alanine carboxypeptidase/D-alanyl-D-alanine endopeptidase [Picosynechococcus sp. PCC 8807]|uniref:D-alanyl-D-alanine carboxypeptidase/D-alanyl-D-alanine endopeptidase n=1 Tax=Picosynechococcus sp. PCC 8807 TaxID=195248 RepID=UPI000810B03D|nr:D-alanyl-D-alanine carboxypeptidase/D-alanyl-D-alanine-endopeptidase [Picosynechococcus sp. PCC 8807]ANV89894.1 D-alanyl-D-alanine carboxypeptidase/D-alanyl-D-alanine-endopeptidase [Picosynechococcus sp. PCC 8807]